MQTFLAAGKQAKLYSDEGIGTAVKNSLEIIIKQVRLEGSFKRGGRIRVTNTKNKNIW